VSTLTDWRSIVDRVRQVVAAEAGVAAGTLTKSTSFVDDLHIDAKQSARLRRALQEEFGVEVPKAEAKQLATVGDLTRFVQAQLRT
jgi:acyl carrier protein